MRTLLIGLMLIGVVRLWAQGQVQITIIFTDPPINRSYRMTVTNNNPLNSGWAVKDVHVLFSTPNVLENPVPPVDWTADLDVPWDAIPNALRFRASNAAARIDPGESAIFDFQTAAPTSVNDFDIQFKVVNSGVSHQYVQRVRVEPREDLPRDMIVEQSVQVTETSFGGSLGVPLLLFTYDLPVPTTAYEIRTQDQDDIQRDFTRYPPDDLTHLDHFFRGPVSRVVDATGVIPGQYWRICLKGAQWCSATLNLSELKWVNGTIEERKPVFGWRFTPSVVNPGSGQRDFEFRLTNLDPERQLFVRNLLIHLKGNQPLECGPDLESWPDRFSRDIIITNITLFPRGQSGDTLVIPITLGPEIPRKRFFYGVMDLLTPNDPQNLPTRVAFEQEEIEVPLVGGILRGSGNQSRPVLVTVTNPNTGQTVNFNTNSNSQGRWFVPLTSHALNLSGLSQAIWNVRVTPQGALSSLFQNVLLLGGDPIDPYLRQTLFLGYIYGQSWTQPWASHPSRVQSCTNPTILGQIALDDWVAPGSSTINRVDWWGTLSNPAQAERKFRIAIYADNGNCQPDLQQGPLHVTCATPDLVETVGVDCQQKTVYRLSAPLVPGFSQVSGVRYWLLIAEADDESFIPGAVDFRWSAHRPKENCLAVKVNPTGTIRKLRDPCDNNRDDLAFVLKP